MAYNQVNDGIPAGALLTNSSNNGLPAIVFTPGLADKTPEQKAAEYNNLVTQGFTDSQIRAAADSTFGTQSASDWSYLTNLANTAGLGSTGIGMGNFSIPAAAASTGALQQAVADPISNLYTQYAGRTADAGGLDYWRNQFGTDVDANEAAIFQRAVAENVAKGVESTATGTNYNPYFTANPDVAAEYMRNTQGMTPEQFAATHYEKFGVNEGRAAPAGVDTADVVADNAGSTAADTSNVSSVYKSIYGTDADADTFNQLTSRFGPTIDDNELRQLVYDDTSLRDNPTGVVKTLQQQILDQGTTKYWTGEAFGSAETTAADMARMLATAGITDINQFGKITVPADAAVTPVYGIRKTFDPEYGEYDQQYITGYTDANGKAVDPSLVRAEYDDSGVTGFLAPVGTKEVFGNKETGVALDPRYDRAQGNIFSGTFAGKGSTGYGVQFKEDGTPVFYTQYGGSTNTLNQIMSDLGPLGQIAFAVATGGLSIPQQIAAQAALSLASGTDLKDIVKNIAVSTVMQGLPTSGVIKDGVSFLNKIDGSGVLGNAFASAASSGTKAALTGQDIGDAILSGAVGGGTAGAIDLMASGIEGFNDLSSSQQNMVKNAISGVVSGQPLDQVLINTAIQAGKNAINTAVDSVSGSGGADDGSAAFIAAKGAGADDDEAMAAANTVTGVQINPIDAGGPNLSTSTTYDPRANTVDSNFGDLQGAIEANAMDDAVRTDKLNVISQTPKFSDAYAQARSLLGPNQTFTWNGKEYSTATAQERPDLSAPKVQPATDESAAETARLNRQNTALVTGNAPDQSAAETARLKSMEKTGFFEILYKDLNDKFKLQGEAANKYLRDNPDSPITESISSTFDALGQLQRGAGGIALAFDNKPLADAIISSGDKLQKFGQSIGSGPEDTKNWNDTLDLMSKAKGAEKLAVLAGRIMDGTSGLARQVGMELRQEMPALFLGGGLLRPTMIASGMIDVGDTGGNAVVEAYDDVIKNNGSHKEGLLAGRKAGTAAAATEAVIQLTLGKLGEVAAGKLDNLISKGVTKIFGEGTVEGLQEAGASAAVDVALDRAIDVNKAITQGIAGTAVSKGTATTTSPVDAATASTATEAASTAANTTAATISNNINTAISSGNTQNVGSVISDSVSTSLDSGASPDVVIDSAITSAITGGADPSVAIDNTITSAINSGVSVDATVGSAITSAVNAGADVNTVIQAATNAAFSTGNDVSIVSNANVVTINNATTNTKTTVDTSTGVKTTVDANTNTTTVVDGNTTTTVDANTNTNTQTTVDGNTTTSTTVDANANTTTQTTITGDTQTTVLTDTNTNTQTTVKVNVNTGEVIDVKETEVPKDWTQPVIEAPSVPGPPTATPITPEEDPAKKAARLRLPQRGSAPGGGGAGLPSGIEVSGDPLRSRVTQGKIDPLARVKEAQAELEREVMMNQIDPRLMSVMQQRMDPQQQTKQFDSDIGALAKLLGGNKEAPANEGKYYSYGAEDSIDDILGGRAANYKEGGFVEPLKASGGSMALPLLAKTGGALGHYKGRENFKEGKHVAGEGDGQSDDIPAWLADGEFVFPADVVSALGNGSTKAGTDKLYEMMHNIRDRARSKGPKDLPPPALKSPLDYLKSSKRSTK